MTRLGNGEECRRLQARACRNRGPQWRKLLAHLAPTLWPVSVTPALPPPPSRPVTGDVWEGIAALIFQHLQGRKGRNRIAQEHMTFQHGFQAGRGELGSSNHTTRTQASGWQLICCAANRSYLVTLT